MIDRSDTDRQVRRVIVIEGLANLVVLLFKVIVGVSTGSLAVLGDAIHSLSDVMNNILAWLIIRISSAPADLEHPYGHRKFETLAVFGLAALLVTLGIELGLQAFRREGTDIVAGTWELWLMLGVLCINIGLAAWERGWAQRLKSDILQADASHTFADVLTTIVVIGGWQLSAIGYVWVDRVCALGVAGLILYLAFNLFRRAVPILVDESALDPALLTDALADIDGVRGVLRVRSRWMGSDLTVDMIITMDPMLTLRESHDIADRIERMLEQRFDVHEVFIHVEPDLDQ